MRKFLLLMIIAFFVFLPFCAFAQEDTQPVETQVEKQIDVKNLEAPVETQQVENQVETQQFDTQKNTVQIEGKETTSIVHFSARRRIYPWWYIYKWGGRHFDLANAFYRPFALRLSKSPKFALLENKDLENILKERKLDVSGDIKPETAKEVGKIVGTKYIMTGLVKNFDLIQTSSRSHGFRIGKFGYETEYDRIYTLKMVCKIDVIDATTGEMVYTTTVKRKIKHIRDVDLISFYRTPIVDKEGKAPSVSPLGNEINELVEELVNNIENENFEKPGYVPNIEKK